MLIVANTVGNGGRMSDWKVISHYYLEAESEGEAWSMATLDLPHDSQITALEKEVKA